MKSLERVDAPDTPERFVTAATAASPRRGPQQDWLADAEDLVHRAEAVRFHVRLIGEKVLSRAVVRVGLAATGMPPFVGPTSIISTLSEDCEQEDASVG